MSKEKKNYRPAPGRRRRNNKQEESVTETSADGNMDDDLLEYLKFEDEFFENNDMDYKDVSDDELLEQMKSLRVVERQTTDSSSVEASNEKERLLELNACRYCHIANPDCVVRCSQCNNWFCSSSVGTKNSSHIITHLVRAKHKNVHLHKESLLGDSLLECYQCGCKNVFILGFITANADSTIILLCRSPCLQQYNTKDINDQSIDWQPIIHERAFLDWLTQPPSDSDLANSSQITYHRIREIEDCIRAEASTATTSSNIQKNYYNNKSNLGESNTIPQNTIDILMHTVSNNLIDTNMLIDKKQVEQLQTLVKYDSVEQYCDIYRPLIGMEAEADRILKESKKHDRLSVRWSIQHGNKYHAFFTLPPSDAENMRITQGDEVLFTYNGEESCYMINGSNWNMRGFVIKTPNNFNEDVGIELAIKPTTSSAILKTIPSDRTSNFSIDFVWKGVSFSRMLNALEFFKMSQTPHIINIDEKKKNAPRRISDAVRNIILSNNVESANNSNVNLNEIKLILNNSKTATDLNCPNLPELNRSQVNAIKTALSSRVCLIQGPPGTGKTVTTASIIYHLAKNCQGINFDKNEKLLVCAPSNIAVDQLAERISRTGITVTRMCAKSREAVETTIQHLSLHEQVKNLKNENTNEINRLLKEKSQKNTLDAKSEYKLRSLIIKAEFDVFSQAQVICCTCMAAADLRLAKFKFPVVLIDEATQASEPECLVPLNFGCKKLIMVGDHYQLGPVVLSKKAAKLGFTQSMFERLIMLGIMPIRLQVQYRMHPALSEFSSNMFYDGTLQNGITVSDRRGDSNNVGGGNNNNNKKRRKSVKFAWPNADRPMFFYCVYGYEEISSSGTSYLNRTEAAAVENVLHGLISGGADPSQIGVVTPYEGQRAYIVTYIQHNGKLTQSVYEQLEIASVDAFQGREKEYIIVTCVRSNEFQGIGFLNDPRRLNVAITRAKYGMIIIGNPKVLAQHALWHHLLTDYQEKKVLVEGPLSNLKESSVILPKATKPFVKNTIGAKFMTSSIMNYESRVAAVTKGSCPLPEKVTGEKSFAELTKEIKAEFFKNLDRMVQ